MKTMKIALTSTQFFGVPPPRYGGLELIVWDLANGLLKLGHKVVIFAPKGSQIPPDGFLYETGEPLGSVQVNWLQSEENMWKLYKDKLPDFDIVHGMNWFGFEYASKAENPNLHVTHTHHGGLNPEWWCKNKPAFKLNMISISRWMEAVYRSQGIESRFCYNGIELEKYPYQEKKGDRLLFVGRLDSFKRPHIAIEVARSAGLGLDVVGGSFVQDVQYMESIKRECDGSTIKLHLDATQEEKVYLYQNAKCVIFPSKMGEPFGLIVPEANACGTPVIGSRDGAIPETIENAANGFICDTVTEMVEAVRKVDMVSPKVCRKRVEDRFSRLAMAKGYERLYTDIMEGREW